MNIGLGTVQFGSDYGISNIQGKTSVEEVRRILEFAHNQDITVLDTAALYGTSEEVLGQSLSEYHQFSIVTKTPIFRKSKIILQDAIHLQNIFTVSLQKLGQQKVYGLLIHHADDLLVDGGSYLMDMMLELKAQGRVAKVGVSVYDGEQMCRIVDKFAIDLIQVPINAFDQRFVGENLSLLKEKNIEIHARSLFLQGLLLMPLEKLNNYFSPIKRHIHGYQQYLKDRRLSLLQGALAFASMCKEVDQVILGVCSLGELRGILDALRSLPQESFDFSEFACQDARMINPALWQFV